MLSNLRRGLNRHYCNLRGWRTDRRIIVFESDDWGAVRMSSRDSLSKLSDFGIQVQKCHYVQNDALASEEDLDRFFNLLKSFTGLHGEHPVITANVIMANPDFEKIKASEFREYHTEPFTETLRKYPNHKHSFKLWRMGMEDGLFHPQFHGREHIQVKRWMKFLKNPNTETRKAFEAGVFGLSTTVTTEKRKSYMASYDWDDKESREFVLKSVSDGLIRFKSLFGYESLSTVAPNYTWHSDVEKVMKENGVKYVQGSHVQKSPIIDGGDFNKIRHFTGQRNRLGQTYLVRNCKFEPSSNPDIDWLGRCLKDIKASFLLKKPAIIETHRVNYIGFISPQNRDNNLKEFEKLLNAIISIWPDVEFMSSDQLGKIINTDE